MPTRFLSDAEVERLEGFPEAIDERDLARYFHLDGADLAFVRRQHSAAGQLGVALQLCALRWLGFIPEDLTAAPPQAITALAAVLDVPPRAIFDYSVRPQTRREHRPLVRGLRWVRGGRRARAGPRVARSSARWSTSVLHCCLLSCAASFAGGGSSGRPSLRRCGWSPGRASARTSRPSSAWRHSSMTRFAPSSTGCWSGVPTTSLRGTTLSVSRRRGAARLRRLT